jgi:hypothetical protein
MRVDNNWDVAPFKGPCLEASHLTTLGWFRLIHIYTASSFHHPISTPFHSLHHSPGLWNYHFILSLDETSPALTCGQNTEIMVFDWDKMAPTARNNHGNASGNANRILSPTLNWKSNNKPEEVDMKEWFLRGAAAGAGLAASMVVVNVVKNWLLGEETEKSEAEAVEGRKDEQKFLA